MANIKKCSAHLIKAVDNTLVCAKVKGEASESEDTTFGLADIIKDAITIVMPIANKRGNRINLIQSSTDGQKYSGDARKFKQLIINLLVNASKFTHNGKITIEYNIISGNLEYEQVSISITDTGCGIKCEELRKIINPFFISSRKIKNENSGAGIGISLSERMVKLIGGSGIIVESKPGIGSRFHFSVKLKKVRVEIEKKTPVPFQAAGVDRAVNVLVIEDDEACANLLCQLLKWDKNINTSIADNENDALTQINSGGFDIVLMDLNINGTSGIDIARKIRTVKNNVPIIAVSGETSDDIIENCYEAGINDFITKPFVINELTCKITDLLKETLHIKNFSVSDNS